MPGLVLGVVGTFALSLILAYTFLRMRCRGIGPPFGRRARYWAAFIVVGTAAVSTAVGMLIVAASSHSGAAYAGIVVPVGLGLSKLPPQRDRDMLPRTMAHVLTLPFSRLYDRMGDDMQDWCDTRIAAAKPDPRWIADAAQYYWNQMGRVSDPRARANLDRWRERPAAARGGGRCGGRGSSVPRKHQGWSTSCAISSISSRTVRPRWGRRGDGQGGPGCCDMSSAAGPGLAMPGP